MKSIDLYVHAMWPFERMSEKVKTVDSKLVDYKEALFDQVKKSFGKMIIISVSPEDDYELVRLAEKCERHYVKVVSAHGLHDNQSQADIGFIKPQNISLIKEIAEADSVVMNGYHYGKCPTHTIAQAIFMKHNQQYYPQSLENTPIDESENLSKILKDVKNPELNESNAPENWRYGITASFSNYDDFMPRIYKEITLSMTDQDTKIYLLNELDLADRVEREIKLGLSSIFFPREEAALRQSIIR